MNTDGAHISKMELNGREITLVELPFEFPVLKNNVPSPCVTRIFKEEGFFLNLKSDFYVGFAILPDEDDPSPKIIFQVTCDGNCATNRPCCPMIVQYDDEGTVLRTMYADESYDPAAAAAGDSRARHTVQKDDVPPSIPMSWWRSFLHKLGG